MNDKIQEFEKEFSQTIQNAVRHCNVARGKEFQEEAVMRLSSLKQKAEQLKDSLIKAEDENLANLMLSYEMKVEAILCELKMWISLKEDDPNRAWEHLISAQYATRTSMQAHDSAASLQNYAERLDALEKVLFPPQMYFSSGMIVGRSDCSICGAEYGTCGHIKGKPYMGKICYRIPRDLKKLTEISIVKSPADKRCRVLSISDGGVMREMMTWRVKKEEKAGSDNPE